MSLQATGKDEEVTAHLEVCPFACLRLQPAHLYKIMTGPVALYDAEDNDATEKSAQAKKKKDNEEQAGKEIRDGLMKSLIPRSHLTDISMLDGASVHKKQGQRSEKSVLLYWNSEFTDIL